MGTALQSPAREGGLAAGLRGRGVWALVAILCVAAAGGGYAVGRSGGADVARARTTGEEAGRARAAADRRPYNASYAQARKAAYRQAYAQAARTARLKRSKGTGK